MHAYSVIKPCLTLCDPMDCSPPGSSVHGVLHARILEWVAIPFSRGPSRPRDRTHVSWVSCLADGFFTTEPQGCYVQDVMNAVLSRSVVSDSATPWAVACQAPLITGFSRWKQCGGLPGPPARDFPRPGIEPRSPALQPVSLPAELLGKPQCYE